MGSMETKTALKWVVALLIGVGVIVLGFRFAAWLLTSFFILNCLVLIIVVLLQSGKAADLAGAFVGAGSSILERASQPAPKPAPTTPPAAPTTTPATTPAPSPSTSQPNTKPASQPPAASQPPPAQPKKP